MMYTSMHCSVRTLILFLAGAHACVSAAPIILTSPLIQYVDGIFINGRRICDMRKLQLEVGFLAIGKKTRDGMREPIYPFLLLQGEEQLYILCADSQHYELSRFDQSSNRVSLVGCGEFKDMASLPKISEKQLTPIWFDTLNATFVENAPIATQADALYEYINAPSTQRYSLHSLITLEKYITDPARSHDQSLHALGMKHALDVMLTFMKHEFEKKSAKFIDDASLFKKAMVGLIQESCTARNREDSLLLSWAKSEKGHEMQSFHQNVRTFKDFYVFSVDLINFLHDLMESCPKAMKQFKELMEQ